MKYKAYKLYSGVFGIFLPNVIKIELYNFEVYRFKVGAFFWRHGVGSLWVTTVTYYFVHRVTFVAACEGQNVLLQFPRN